LGFTLNLGAWVIQEEWADHWPLFNIGIAHEHFPEFNEKVKYIDFILGPFAIGLGVICNHNYEEVNHV
jgi:hypothetical protein